MRAGFRLRIVRVTARPVEVRESITVDLPTSAATAWAFMWDPASSLTLLGVETAAALPGRTGLGEVQAFVERAPGGRVGVLHEVIALDPGRRAVTRSIVDRIPSGATLTVEATGPGSCRVTQEFWARLPAGLPVGTQRLHRAESRRRLELIAHRLTEWAAGRL